MKGHGGIEGCFFQNCTELSADLADWSPIRAIRVYFIREIRGKYYDPSKPGAFFHRRRRRPKPRLSRGVGRGRGDTQAPLRVAIAAGSTLIKYKVPRPPRLSRGARNDGAGEEKGSLRSSLTLSKEVFFRSAISALYFIRDICGKIIGKDRFRKCKQ